MLKWLVVRKQSEITEGVDDEKFHTLPTRLKDYRGDDAFRQLDDGGVYVVKTADKKRMLYRQKRRHSCDDLWSRQISEEVVVEEGLSDSQELSESQELTDSGIDDKLDDVVCEDEISLDLGDGEIYNVRSYSYKKKSESKDGEEKYSNKNVAEHNDKDNENNKNGKDVVKNNAKDSDKKSDLSDSDEDPYETIDDTYNTINDKQNTEFTLGESTDDEHPYTTVDDEENIYEEIDGVDEELVARMESLLTEGTVLQRRGTTTSISKEDIKAITKLISRNVPMKRSSTIITQRNPPLPLDFERRHTVGMHGRTHNPLPTNGFCDSKKMADINNNNTIPARSSVLKKRNDNLSIASKRMEKKEKTPKITRKISHQEQRANNMIKVSNKMSLRKKHSDHEWHRLDEDENKDDCGQIRLMLNHYSPSDISIFVKDALLNVCGRHLIKKEYGYDSTEFRRVYPVPQGLTTRDIHYRYEQDGTLVIRSRRHTIHSH